MISGWTNRGRNNAGGGESFRPPPGAKSSAMNFPPVFNTQQVKDALGRSKS